MTEPRRSTSPSAPPNDAFTPDLLGETTAPSRQNGVPPLEEGPDPFDPERLRLKPDLNAADGAGKVLKVGVRKPAREWFIRTHPDRQYYLETKVIELKSTGSLYLVAPDILPELEALGESTLTPKRLFFTVTRQGDYFFWPIALHDPLSERRVDDWTKTAVEAAEQAKHQWVRVSPNQRMGYYDVLASAHPIAPLWPSCTLGALLRVAFRELYIESWDHDILRSLRPEGRP